VLPALVPLLALAAAHDPCPRTRTLVPGPGTSGLYRTPAPFEHFDSRRSQVFPYSCTLEELTARRHPRIRARVAPGRFDTPYSIVTRGRRDLYVYGYAADAAAEGAQVARVDTGSLRVVWRTRIRDRRPAGQWSYPGVALAHRDGRIFAIYGNVLVKLDARSGRTLARRTLPEDPNGTGAAYNGMVVLPDGRIAAKKVERGPCPSLGPATPALVGAFAGLTCAARNRLPSVVAIVDPRRLRVLSRVVPPEPVTGRVTFGGGYLYCAGRTHLFRYRYRHGRLRLDRRFGLVTYRTGAQTPGTGPGLLGRFVVVQTNFLPSSAPLTVTAVDTRNPRRVFRARPFADLSQRSWIVSKPALDSATRTVVTHDSQAGRMAALRLDPTRGFSVRWRRPIASVAFSALVGPAAHRQIVIPDLRSGQDHVMWLDERSGREQAVSPPLGPGTAPGNIVVPGFYGRFYYGSAVGRLWSLRPTAR
jgi:hypothetical protein